VLAVGPCFRLPVLRLAVVGPRGEVPLRAGGSMRCGFPAALE